MEITTRVQLHNWENSPNFKLRESNAKEVTNLKSFDQSINDNYKFITCTYKNVIAVAAYESEDIIKDNFKAKMIILRDYTK